MTAILSRGDELNPCMYLWGTMCVRITDNNEYDNTLWATPIGGVPEVLHTIHRWKETDESKIFHVRSVI